MWVEDGIAGCKKVGGQDSGLSLSGCQALCVGNAACAFFAYDKKNTWCSLFSAGCSTKSQNNGEVFKKDVKGELRIPSNTLTLTF